MTARRTYYVNLPQLISNAINILQFEKFSEQGWRKEGKVSCVRQSKIKNRRTVARVRHVKNLKTFTGYIQLKTFKLSAVKLQPSMDKNGKNDNYNKYKNRWDYKKNILKWEKNMYLSVNKLIVLFQKNRVLIRERPWIVICMTCRSGVPWF